MSEPRKKITPKNLHLRAKLPQYFRIAAIAVLVVTLLGIGIGFYKARNNPEFRMKGFPTSLSKDVVASINGYERREMEGERVLYRMNADRATTFADEHQELENVTLEVFDTSGTGSDIIKAQKAVHVPGENKNFTAYFAGDVNIATRDGLKVKTEQITYAKETETATAEEQVEFERDGISGRAFGAVVKIADKHLELLRDVDVKVFENSELARSGISHAHMRSGFAAYDQAKDQLVLQQGVEVTALSQNKTSNLPQTLDLRSGRAVVFLSGLDSGGRDVSKLELYDNVTIDSREGDGQPTKIESGYALYQKDIDRFDLRSGVKIATLQGDKPTNITASNAVYEQSAGRIVLSGSAEVTQASDFVKGETITALLYPGRSIKRAEARGSAYLRQISATRTSEIAAAQLNADFNESQVLHYAEALGGSNTFLTPVNAVDYTKITVTAESSAKAFLKGEGAFDKIFTDGRTSIKLDAPSGAPDAANKVLTADSVRTFFDSDGRNLHKAEAIGDAELLVEPHNSAPANYRTLVKAPRFDCDFFPSGNNARLCKAGTKTRTVRTPTVSAANRGQQTILADSLTAHFSESSRDIERFDAAGSAKFTELERNAVAETMTFTAVDEVVRLRGGEPTVWDNAARAKSREIDWNTREQRSYFRGGISSTYYSQKQSGGAVPFGDSDKPVFLTAAAAEFDHANRSAVYNGNARGWQENNYVRADKFFIQEPQGRFQAEGSVQSLLYNARRKEDGVERNVPVYATASKMTYARDSRQLRYEKDVDIRQGTDRILGGIANVFLDDRNEVARTDIEGSVVITQPKRRASGDFAQYVVADEVVTLRGNPARVEDAENGSSSGGQLVVHLRSNRVVGEGKVVGNSTGRTRSVYKVRN